MIWTASYLTMSLNPPTNKSCSTILRLDKKDVWMDGEMDERG